MAKSNTATNTIDHVGALKDQLDSLQAERSKAFADFKAAERAPNARVDRDAQIDRGVDRHRQNVDKWLDGINGQKDPTDFIDKLPPLASADFIKSLVLSNPSTGEYLKKFFGDKFGDGATDSERPQNVTDAKAKVLALDRQIVKVCSSAGFELPTYLLPEAVIDFREKTRTFDEKRVSELQTELDSIVDRCSRIAAHIRNTHTDLAKLLNSEGELNSQLSHVEPRKRDESPTSKNLKSVRDQISSINAQLAELQSEEGDLAKRRGARSKLLNNVKGFLREHGIVQ